MSDIKLTGIITADPSLSGGIGADPSMGAGGLLPSGPRGKQGKVWLPDVDEDGELSWELGDGTTPPEGSATYYTTST